MMRKITLGTTYYNNPNYLKNFIDKHYDYVDYMVIVDDGSDVIKAKDIIDKSLTKISLYEVTKDYGFNSHGCRNLIMTQTKTDWVVLLDSDREFLDPDYALYEIKTLELQKDVRYRFSASIKRKKDYLNWHPSVNDFLIHKDHFFSVGGYDEEIIGIRDGDRQFFKQLLTAGGKEKHLLDVEIALIRSPTSKTKEPNIKSQHDTMWTKD